MTLRLIIILALLVVGALMFGCLRSAGAQAPPPRFVMLCAACHGYDGVGHDALTPNLAGQNVAYLYNQMMAFRSGTRVHPEMNFFSGQMTLEELQAIAIYYSVLPR
jgi:cytochrome c553